MPPDPTALAAAAALLRDPETEIGPLVESLETRLYECPVQEVLDLLSAEIRQALADLLNTAAEEAARDPRAIAALLF